MAGWEIPELNGHRIMGQSSNPFVGFPASHLWLPEGMILQCPFNGYRNIMRKNSWSSHTLNTCIQCWCFDAGLCWLRFHLVSSFHTAFFVNFHSHPGALSFHQGRCLDRGDGVMAAMGFVHRWHASPSCEHRSHSLDEKTLWKMELNIERIRRIWKDIAKKTPTCAHTKSMKRTHLQMKYKCFWRSVQ